MKINIFDLNKQISRSNDNQLFYLLILLNDMTNFKTLNLFL